ncbi:MAG: hypothetical protein BGN88_12850 [Clostridiales bacterium 43-6]|nr:MAG: hypothetical protein BGN88_12850 [Clostridiales bacterium 43-6]
MDNQLPLEKDLALDGQHSFYYDIFQSSSIGQIVVNLNLNIVSANSRMFQYFQINPHDAKGLPFGCVFNCTELNHNYRECGKTKNCKSCGILNAVRDILLSDTSIKGSVIQYSFRIEKRHAAKWFYLSGANVATSSGDHYAALVFTDITELKQQEKRLREKLTLDLATGTMNKHSLVDALQKLVEPGITSCRFTTCMIDFDNFKKINDQCGHLMGDKVLKVFSDIARKHIRKNDILGRYGGEEFIFVFNGTDHIQSLQILKRIHKELMDRFAQEFNAPVTFSAGVVYVDNAACFLPQCADLLGDVDRMLYQAKNRGRGRAMSSTGETLFISSDI